MSFRCPDEPGARPLLTLLRCALRPQALDEETAADLLTGPLGQADGLGLRKLRRATGGRPLVEALTRADSLDLVADRIANPARRVAGLLAVASAPSPGGGTAEDVLWAVWDASGLAERWGRQAEHDPAADRDLDAVLALFDRAARFADELAPGSPQLFLDSLSGQEIAGGHPRRAGGPRGLRPGADRAPVQGPGMGCRRGRGRAGGDLARPADARLAAGRGRACRGGAWPLRPGRAGQPARRGAGAPRLASPPSCWPRSAACSTSRSPGRGAPGRDRGGRRGVGPAAVPVPRPSWRGYEIEIQRAGAAHPLAVPARLVADLRRAAADHGQPGAVREAAAAQLARLASAGVRGADPRSGTR